MPLFIAITPVRITLGLARRAVFCRSSETAAAADYFLAVRTDREKTLRSHVSSLSVGVCGMDFVESVAVCPVLLRNRAKRRKEVLVSSACKSKTTTDHL